MLYWLSGSLKSKIEWQWIVNCVCFCECFRDAESEGGAPSKDNTDVFGERRDPNALKVWSLNVLWFNDCLRVYFEGLLMGCAFCFTVMDVIVGTFTEDGYWTSLGNGFEAWEACWCWRRLIMYYNLSFFIVYGCIFILILSVLFLNIESLLVCVTVEDLLLEYCETKFSFWKLDEDCWWSGSWSCH